MGSSKLEILDWLLGLAVRLEYGERRGEYKKFTKEYVASQRSAPPKLVSHNALDSLDFSSPDFQSGVRALADSLKIPHHPDTNNTLLAICKFVSLRLNKESLEDPSSVISKGEPFPLKETDLGFDTHDKSVNEAAKILRLLHIQDLRNLQTKINETIVSVQAITANPKTDTRLGKVGR